MSINNIRENVVAKVVTTLESIDSIKKVSRKLPKGLEDLQSVADTSIPLCGVNSELPKPEPHKPGRGKSIWADIFETSLDIFIVCYYRETGDYALDQIKGDLYDDIFRTLNVDQTLSGLVYYFEILNEVEELVAEPYGAFRMTLRVKYQNGIGGV